MAYFLVCFGSMLGDEWGMALKYFMNKNLLSPFNRQFYKYFKNSPKKWKKKKKMIK